MGDKRHYWARCHCGLIRFSFWAEEITTGKRCTCSICIRKGAIMSSRFIPAADFQAHHETELLSAFLWGDDGERHLFCKGCGVHPYHGNPDTGYRVNLGCVEGIDPQRLEVGQADKRAATT